MSPVESLASGKPVISAPEGGMTEIFATENFGVFLRAPVDSGSVVAGVRAFNESRSSISPIC